MELGITKTQITEEESCPGRNGITIGEIFPPRPGGEKHKDQRRRNKNHGTSRIWKTQKHIQRKDPPGKEEHLKL
jgi:hypothetical protein